jgi:hypothetical protein
MLVDEAWDDPAALTLRQQMRAYESAARLVLTGGTFSSTSANGRHVALTGSGPGQATQLELAESWRRLIDVYDAAAAELGIAYADTLMPEQEQPIKDQMMASLREVMGYTMNWMYLAK